MVATGAAYRDRTDDHQFVEMLRIREFGDGWGLDVAPLEHLFQVHLGHTPRCFIGVVVMLNVNHQTAQDTLHLLLNFIEQQFKLAGLNEIGDVVIGMEPLARGLDALTDFDRHRNTFVLFCWVHGKDVEIIEVESYQCFNTKVIQL